MDQRMSRVLQVGRYQQKLKEKEGRKKNESRHIKKEVLPDFGKNEIMP